MYKRKLPRNIVGFDFLGIGTMVGGIAGAGATAYAANKNLNAVEKTNATNLQLAREQNAWNERMVHEQNEYNNTANQLQRWMDAGLNPNTFAQNATPSVQETAPQSADLANQQAPNYSMFGDAASQFANSIGRYTDYILASRKLDQEDRRIDQTDKQLGINTRLAESQLKTADQMRKNMEQEFKRIASQTDLNKTIADVNKAELGKIAAMTDLYIAQWQDVKENITSKQLDNAFKSRTMSTRVKLMSAELFKTYTEAWKNQQDVRESVQRVSLMAYDRKIKSQQIELNGLDVHMYRTRNGQMDFQFQLEKKWRETERANQIFVERCKAFSALLGGVSSLSSFLPYGRSSRVTDAMLGNSMQSPPQSWANPPADFTQYY